MGEKNLPHDIEFNKRSLTREPIRQHLLDTVISKFTTLNVLLTWSQITLFVSYDLVKTLKKIPELLVI
jgi:hypothetical protein